VHPDRFAQERPEAVRAATERFAGLLAASRQLLAAFAPPS
jgi:hypothetical protein